MTEKRIILLGAGGHALSCIDVVEQEGTFTIAGILGMPDEVGNMLLGHLVIGTDDNLTDLASTVTHALVTVGQISSVEIRKKLFTRAKVDMFTLPVVVSPQAYVSPYAALGEGSIVMPGAVVAAGATIGRNCIINTGAIVDHDVAIGDHCHVSTRAIVNGGVKAGNDCFIGSGAIIREGTMLGDSCFIGMGMRVIKDLPAKSRHTGHD